MTEHQHPRLIVLAVDDDEEADAMLRSLPNASTVRFGHEPQPAVRLATDGDVYLAAMHGLDLRDVTKSERERQRDLLAEDGTS